jgi:hypothetical protein
MTSNEDIKSNKNQGVFVIYNIIMLILFAICISNYSESDSKEDGLHNYWLYAWVKLIISIYMICSIIILGCCLICAIKNENIKCGIAINMLILISICGLIITDLTFMFILIHNNKEITKFKYISDNGTMLQVLCMINMFFDLMTTAFIICSCLIVTPFVMKMCRNKDATINTEISARK